MKDAILGERLAGARGKIGALRSDANAVRKVVQRAMLRPRTYPGFAKEILMTSLNVALYPAGLISDALKVEDAVRLGDKYTSQVPLRYIDPVAASTPIILLHGYFHNRSAFVVMKRSLRKFGFRSVDTMNYNVIGHDVQELAHQLAAHVDEVLECTEATHVHLIGHSLGGLVARYYIQKLGGHEKVHTCITLGTPHRGTHAAWVGRGKTARQLRPGSLLLRQLARSSRAMPVRFISIYSNLDSLVLPAVNAKITEPALRARNVLVKDLGHLSLLISRPIIRAIAEALANPDAPADVDLRPARNGRARTLSGA
ncbi:MAG TPA: alpha/beta fold hydrolase [Actinomycetota bacterium]|nr:alpha/beta fold hydrolase [Actinomycetota bacterium]